MSSSEDLVDAPPPDYNPRWARTRRLTSSFGQWLGVVDRDDGAWERTGTMPRTSHTGYYQMIETPSDAENQEENNIMTTSYTDNAAARQAGVSRNIREPETRARRTLRLVKEKWKQRKHRAEIRNTLPTFRPWFTVTIAIVNIGMFVAVCISNGITAITLTPEEEHGFVKDFDGRTVPDIREKPANFFIGPTATDLVHHGAKYATCMRKDSRLEYELQVLRNKERLFKCCESTNTVRCGMMMIENCNNSGNTIIGGKSACVVQENYCQAGIALRPCCLGSTGQCELTTSSYCSFHNGVWHTDKLLCHEAVVDCLRDICELTWSSTTFSGSDPDQWYRLLLAMFLHNGVIQLVILLLMQLYLCYRIERRIGWLRIFLIYMLSGVGGYLTSCILDPDAVGVGPSGALYGLLGVQLVELLQSWKLLDHPFSELLKLLINIILLLALGLLPYIDNFANIGGFIFGILSSFILVPFISIGKWDRLTKLCLISIALPVMVILFFIGFVIFYNVQDSDFCSWCNYLNCIPFTDDFCDGFDLSAFFQQSPDSNSNNG